MGLHIVGHCSGGDIDWNYHQLHWVRTLAITVDFNVSHKSKVWDTKNPEQKWKMASIWEGKGFWKDSPDYWQLLHFADNEGYLIPEVFLEGVEFKELYYLGSIDKLYKELYSIKTEITSNMELYESYKEVRKAFWKLFNLVDAEQNEGGHITFS